MSLHSQSIWEGTDQEPHNYPVFEGHKDVDVAIVGGGISGLTAALLLAGAGKEVLVLEALQVGMGTTGNSTGNLYATVDESLSRLRKKWNKDVMKSVATARRAAMSFIEDKVHRYNLDCDFSRQPHVYFAEKTSIAIDDFIKQEHEALEEAGLKARILSDAGLPFATVKALRTAEQAQFHPLKYVRQLARIVSQESKIYENSRVLEVDDKTGILKTARGTVKAAAILLATHTPVGVYTIHSALAPYREFGVAGELAGRDFPGGIFWGLDEPRRSLRRLQHGEKKYVMVIGDKFKTGQHGDTRDYINGEEKFLRDRLGVPNSSFVWGGQQYRPADGLPYIGRHNDKTYFMTGFGTDGLTYGTLAAMIVADTLLGVENPWQKMFAANRFTPLKSARDFIAENADAVIQYFKDVPWNVDAKTLGDIKPGEGRLIEQGQQKWAVYKEESGKVYAVSAVCTHMKCVVNWNQSEKTWDCPCHGSRFNYDGKVMEGPALFDLPGKQIE